MFIFKTPALIYTQNPDPFELQDLFQILNFFKTDPDRHQSQTKIWIRFRIPIYRDPHHPFRNVAKCKISCCCALTKEQ